MYQLCVKLGRMVYTLKSVPLRDSGVCVLSHNLNEDVNGQGWVECTLCGQWVHKICMGMDGKKYRISDNFPCGCDALCSGCLPLKFYESLKIEDVSLDFKMVVEEILKNISFRNSLFAAEGNIRLKRIREIWAISRQLRW